MMQQKMYLEEHIIMSKQKANHLRPGMNAAKAQGKGAGYNEEFGNEQLSEKERQFNKKKKKNQ